MSLDQPSYISTIAPGSNIQQRLVGGPSFTKRPDGDQTYNLTSSSSSSMNGSHSQTLSNGHALSANSSSSAVSLLSEGLAQRALARWNNPSGVTLHSSSSSYSHSEGRGEGSGEKGLGAGGEAVSSPAALGCTGHAGNPGVMEAKQHGGSSALQALTAIDCIREESSSIADSGMLAAERLLEEGDEDGVEEEVSGSLRKHSGSTLGGDAGGAGGEERGLDSSRGSAGHEGSSWSSLLTGLLLRRSTSDGEVGPVAAAGDGQSSVPAVAAPGGGGTGSAGGLCNSRSKVELEGVGNSSGGSGSSSVSMWALEDDGDGGAAAGSKETGEAAMGGGRPASGILKTTAPAESRAAAAALNGEASSQKLLIGGLVVGGGGKGGENGAVGAGRDLPLQSPFSNGSVDPDRSVKRVRFTVERPAGATASRDRSLLYTAPELMQGHR